MKIYWHETPGQSREFTSKLLKYWWTKHGGKLVNQGERCDLVCASFCTPREINVLKSARSIANSMNVPLLAGGPEAYIGSTYLAWADYLCIGEGYALLQKLVTEGLGILDTCDHVLSRGDPNKIITPDYDIPWNQLPAIQTSPTAYYYMAGRGCYRKCQFCYTSWTQPHQSCPQIFRAAALKNLPGKSHAIFVTNDDGGMASQSGSMTVEKFLAYKGKKLPRVIRLGIERFTEDDRRSVGKPVSDGDIAAVITKAKRLGRQLELFYIIGWHNDPESNDAFLPITNLLSTECVRHPRIYLKFTWFEPAPHTPLADYDLTRLVTWDYQKAALSLRAISGRYRIFKAGQPGYAIWSAVLRRLGPAKALAWAEKRNVCSKIKTFKEAIDLAVSIVGEHIVTGREKDWPWKRIKCLIRRP